MGFDIQALLSAFVTALDMSALDHMMFFEAVQPSLTLPFRPSIPPTTPNDESSDLYLAGAGLKGLLPINY